MSGETGDVAEGPPTAAAVREALRAVVDPCTAATGSNLDIVEMGLVADVTVSGGAVTVRLRLTTPACHMVPYFIQEITDRVAPLPGVTSVTVDTDRGLEWRPEMMSEAARAKRRSVLEGYDRRSERRAE